MSERNLNLVLDCQHLILQSENLLANKLSVKTCYLISALYPSRRRIRKVKKNQNNFAITCIGDII